MIALLVGIIVVVGGVFLIVPWWNYFLKGLQASVPIFMILGGLLAIVAGISSIRDNIAAKKERAEAEKEEKEEKKGTAEEKSTS
jgi:F0F1-type ATP synthase assembly protein I